ncbi:hypothetical protein J2W49_005175 [Hydrogenophaga palleronii]|uniref:Uncharacterized protein n=1 Tax=Hydrogenophaga palleronii TaxID=65655 RepID=A0ABU1WV45_9BURK|nr:hypothetical protein [Hydrogenophaga palleronii]
MFTSTAMQRSHSMSIWFFVKPPVNDSSRRPVVAGNTDRGRTRKPAPALETDRTTALPGHRRRKSTLSGHMVECRKAAIPSAAVCRFCCCTWALASKLPNGLRPQPFNPLRPWEACGECRICQKLFAHPGCCATRLISKKFCGCIRLCLTTAIVVILRLPSKSKLTLRKLLVLPINSRVVLRSFNGSSSAPLDCRTNQNYWTLIGDMGTVVDTLNHASRPGRVLVRFDAEVSTRGLSCHNAVPNSLYILESDLEKMQ